MITNIFIDLFSTQSKEHLISMTLESIIEKNRERFSHLFLFCKPVSNRTTKKVNIFPGYNDPDVISNGHESLIPVNF